MIDDFADALPDDLARVPVRRARSDARTGCRSRRPRTTSRAASSPTSTARRRCRTSGRAARPRAAACTARTGSRPTRCSTDSCSAPRVVEAIAAGTDATRDPTGAMTGVLDLGNADARSSTPSCADERRRRSTPTRCAARSSARCRPTAASSAMRGGLETATRHARATSSASPTTSAPRDRTRRFEVRNLLRVVARDRRRRDRRARSRAARTRAPTSRTRPTRLHGRFVLQRRGRHRSSSPLAGLRAGRDRRERPSTHRRRGPQRARRDSRSPRISACSATSRRSRASTRTRQADAAFVAREEGVLAGTAAATEVYRQVDADVAARVGRRRRRRDRGRHDARPAARAVALDPRRRARRAELPVALLGRRVVDAPVRDRRRRGEVAHPRHAQDVAGPARRATRGGAGRRRFQPPRLALGRGADQGQPSRRLGLTEAVDRARARWPGRDRRGRVRHARAGDRGA